MSSHKSTPASVLNAPMIRREVLSDQSDLTRAERRRAFRGLDAKGKPALLLRAKGTIPRDQQLPTRNRPYVKGQRPATRSGRPVRRNALARMGSVAGRVRSTIAGRRERA